MVFSHCLKVMLEGNVSFCTKILHKLIMCKTLLLIKFSCGSQIEYHLFN